MAIYKHEATGYQFECRHYSKEEMCKIDESLPNTGASQEAGFYFDEIDGAGDPIGGPSGPYETEALAWAACCKIIEDL